MLNPRTTLAAAVLVLAALAASGCGASRKSAKLLPPEEHYRLAEAFMEARKFNKAVAAYQRVDTAKDRELRAQVHLRMADAYFERPNILNLAEAQSRYQSFLNFFPLSDQAPYAQHRFARCLMLQINKPERDQAPTLRAMAEFRKVEELYPNSSWVAESRTRLGELEDHLSSDALLKAKFYFRRKGYKSAVSRLEEILEDNPDFPGRDEVLFMLGMSQHKLLNPAAGDTHLLRLLQDFPESKYAGKARSRISSPQKQPETPS